MYFTCPRHFSCILERTWTGLLSWNRETISKQINFHYALNLLKSDSHCTVQWRNRPFFSLFKTKKQKHFCNHLKYQAVRRSTIKRDQAANTRFDLTGATEIIYNIIHLMSEPEGNSWFWRAPQKVCVGGYFNSDKRITQADQNSRLGSCKNTNLILKTTEWMIYKVLSLYYLHLFPPLAAVSLQG